jgi:molybdopterin-containing oxidoreductase family iron-sulfur binding subunit
MGDHHSHSHLPVLANDAETDSELSRRRFLTLLGASAALATGAGCKKSTGEVVPYTKKQAEIIPGVATYYASTYQEGEIVYPVLVKAREGRPIHIQGNDEHPDSLGKTSYRAIAELLGLYDPDRLHGPVVYRNTCSWEVALKDLTQALKAASNQEILLFMPALLSPSRRALLERLKSTFPKLRPIEWEPAANHAARQAELALLGDVSSTRYRYEKADVLVSFEADILGVFGDAVSAIAGFAAGRSPSSASGAMNRLYVLEGGFSVTGSKADVRLPLRPSALPRIAFGILAAVHKLTGLPFPQGFSAAALDPFALDRLPEAQPWKSELRSLVRDLVAAKGKALVVAGPAASPEVHSACLLLNHALDAFGNTIQIQAKVPAPSLATWQDLGETVNDMAAGRVGMAIFWDVNVAYDYPDSEAFRAALAKVPKTVHMGLLLDETASLCTHVLPIHHWLESWGDFETRSEYLNLQQPLVAPLYDTLQAEDILLKCLAEFAPPVPPNYQMYLKQRWQADVQPVGSPVLFAQFWNTCLHDGFLRRKSEFVTDLKINGEAAAKAAAVAAQNKLESTRFELVMDADPRLFDGRHANNGWLQEMPDPVNKVSWENPLLISVADADRLQLKNGDMVIVSPGPPMPILRQRGQAEGVLRLNLGHGKMTGSVAAGIGTRAAAFRGFGPTPIRLVESLRASGGRRPLPLSQVHDTRDGRDIARLWSMAEYAQKPETPLKVWPSLYNDQTYTGQRWGMAIDLSACVGCGACVVACQSENNVPVVGPEQVLKGRAMHWMRVDRYYEGNDPSPQVVHEPMLCQQCDNAPCETVCPVQATNHGPDGINQMAYNRCVGTRYCSNNCPYKVRRFNFLDFTSELPPSIRLAMNPEVTVRPRGVMEKCNFCVQRINNGKQVAKREGRELADHDVVPACAVACPAKAIVFGDIKNPESQVSKVASSNRGFRVLDELGTKPAITYLAALTNPARDGGK